MPKWLLVGVVPCLLLIAGCTQPAPSHPQAVPIEPGLGETTTPGSIQTTPPSIPQTGRPTATDLPFQGISLADCRAGLTGYTWPGTLGPGDSIPGWEPSATTETTTVYMDFLACGRISFANVERGPVKILLETHDSISAPAACREDARSVRQLHRLWVSDVELAAALGSVGVPAAFAAMEHRLGVPGVSPEEWSFLAANERSVIEWHSLDETFQASFTSTTRLAWPGAGGGVEVMDVEETGSNQRTALGLNPGYVLRPLLYAEAGPSEYAGTGQVAKDLSWRARHTSYEDASCTA